MLRVENTSAGYDFLQVLWNISFEVGDGEFVALLGPNGAGKTTTLRTIAGQLKPMDGQIFFQDRPLSGLPTHEITRLGISFVSEKLNLFVNMSVYENLLMGAYIIKEEQVRKDTVEFVFELFPRLAERRRQLAGTLSGGERKMLAIARGLMCKPKLMLVDEPSLGLAPYLVKNVFQALKLLHGQGLTVLLVEQNVHATLEITDRAYVIEHGRIVLEGASDELARNEHVQNVYLGL